jgi:competence protein ComEA
VTLTEGETKALLASSLLVLLAAFGRLLLQPPAAEVGGAGLEAGDVDSALVVAEAAYAEVERRGAKLAPGERIDPNVAGEVELDRLPGVGPALARAILRSRQIEGPFHSLEEMERVPGLGSRSVRRLAPYVDLPETAGSSRSPGGEVGKSSQPESRDKWKEGLDLNRASAEELEALPGIGPSRAQAVVRWRAEHGSFRNLEDLLEVPGIGPATLERLRSLVVVRP